MSSIHVGPVGRDPSTAEFFDAAAEGRFLISRCPNGHASKPQSHLCPTCGSQDLHREDASGRAKLVSWVVIPGRPTDDEPHPDAVVPAIAELEEGPWWWSLLIGADPSQRAAGTPLRVAFEQANGGEPVPVFVLE